MAVRQPGAAEKVGCQEDCKDLIRATNAMMFIYIYIYIYTLYIFAWLHVLAYRLRDF